ncbi:cation-independent mannose-6-phosphate receptor isoform X2 [Ceratina calcarata]|uniref:Cation-independent mannose-6-phosphate receptor isoform X2 n=1 Tax=Ceratina calcarata TaxID=156304 RepID=A0AAJ7J6J3_9HYME|nr:cation-independent mannose-6-phosphate receptor isoform X2 [Ceratina calcarata]
MELNNFVYFFVIIFAVSATNNYCIIPEPIRKVSTYNFTTLTNLKDPARDINLHFSHVDSGSIRLQLCQQLKKKCNSKDGYSVCFEKDKKEIGIGKFPAKVDMKDGRILFVFTGDNCRDNTNYTVNIIMKCDYEVMGDSKPEFIHETFEKCTLFLIWRTAAACGNRTIQNCTLTDKATGLHYDLSSLTKYSENYVIPLGDRTAPKIILNVCHSVIFEYNALCQMTNGACLQDPNKNGYESLGDVQKPPYLDNNSNIKLEYEDGAICKTDKKVPHIKTTITFTCDFNAVDTIPEYIGGSEECNYQLLWRTAAACSTESLKNRTASIANKSTVKCVTEDDAVNLGSLIKSTDNYVIKMNKTEFYINVCRPLVSNPHTNLKCVFDGSAVCKVSSGTNGNVPVTNETSLGFPKESPIINDNHETVLRYTDGSTCPENEKRLISSNITFPCDTSDKLPEFKKYEDCTYVFEWKTRLTCGAVMGNWVSPCIIKDPSHECDLSLLQKVYHVKSKQGKGYNISICNSNKESTSKGCNSAICDDNNNNYGSIGSVIFDYGRDEIKIQYTNGGKCADKSSYTSEVRLICTKMIGIGTPELLWESECSAEFEWHTNVTCSCSSSISGNSYPNSRENNATPIISSSSHTGTIAGITLTIVALISAFIYFRNPDKRACFKSCYNLFNSRRDNGRVQYCRLFQVNTTEEARLLLDIDPTQCQTDSDDDLLNA